MRKRLKDLIGEEDSNSLILGTFHAICCRILHLHARHVDLDPNFTVADTEASKVILDKLRSDPQLKISQFTRQKMAIGKFVSVYDLRWKCQYFHKNILPRCNIGHN